MSLTYGELLSLVQEFKKALSQKLLHFILVSPRTYVAELEREKILISLQEPYLRIHLTRKKYSLKPDPFAHTLEKQLKGKSLTNVSLDPSDRRVFLDFSERRLIIDLIPRNPNLSLEGSVHLNPIKASIPRSQNPKPSNISSKEVEERFDALIAEKEKEELLKKLAKERAKLEKELKIALGWEEKMKKALLVQSSLYSYNPKTHTILLIGEEKLLHLPRNKSPHEYLESLLKGAKRLKGAIDPLQKKLANIQLPSNPKKVEPRKPYIEHVSKTGFEIWIGRSAKDNDKLTFSLGKGSDLWLHAHHEKGAHVIVRAKKGRPFDKETIEEAKQLALKHSQGKNKGKAEVIMTLLKNVKRTKTAGKVFVSDASFEWATLRPLP